MHKQFRIPHIQDFALILAGKKVFSVLDLSRAYNHIPIEPASIPKTAITTPLGLYEFRFMAFGLCNAAQTFQRHYVFVYIDDICIASIDENQHLEHFVCSIKKIRINNQFGEMRVRANPSEISRPHGR